MMSIAWTMSEDHTVLKISLPTVPHPSALEMEAPEVDDLIRNLIEMRARMLPAVPMADPDPGMRMTGSLVGRWYVQPMPGAEHFMLALLHPGARWIAIVLDRAGLTNLSTTARKIANTPLEPLRKR